jgi:hypothetical protein
VVRGVLLASVPCPPKDSPFTGRLPAAPASDLINGCCNGCDAQWAVAYAPAQPRRGPAPATGLQFSADLCGGAREGLSLSGADRIEQALALTEDQAAKFQILEGSLGQCTAVSAG